MKIADIPDYFRLKRIIQNPWAFVWLRKHFRPGELFEVRFRDGRVFCLRSGTGDRHVFHRSFLRDEYGILDARLSNLDCVIDIGGHIGVFSFLVAPFSQRVLAFEPMAENFDLLKRNLSPPEFRHVSCVNAAVTDRKKEVRIYRSSGSGSHSAYQSNRVGRDFEVVPGVSLEDIFRDYDVERCDLLKVDCEGAEYEILFSAGENVMSRISRIVLEYHDVPGGKQSWNVDALASYLKGQGFKVNTKPSKRHANQGIMRCHR